MSYSFVKRIGTAGLTRISVSGMDGVYRVKIGVGDQVDSACVRWERGTLRCDCGRRTCGHIESLEACGFLNDGGAELQAEAA